MPTQILPQVFFFHSIVIELIFTVRKNVHHINTPYMLAFLQKHVLLIKVFILKVKCMEQQVDLNTFVVVNGPSAPGHQHVGPKPSSGMYIIMYICQNNVI